MGYKSTTTLTRASADLKYIELYLRRKSEQRRERMQARIDGAGYLGRPYMRDHDLSDIDEDVLVKLFHHVDSRIREEEWTTKARMKTAPMTDTELENALEALSDTLGGTYDFLISERPQDDD